MQGKQTLDHHRNLMTRMATTVGADLDEAELRGDLPPEMQDDMLMACTGCSAPGACQTFLATAASGSQPPDYCRNSSMLLNLAAE